jgi:nucleoside-diphosphate-sugar epimerase
MEERRETILITGSRGRIGSLLAERLAPGYRIAGLDHGEPECAAAVDDCFGVDLASGESVREALRGVRQRHGSRLASVIHLAGYYSFSEKDHPLHEEVNVHGTERLLRGLREFQVDQLLFSSTLIVHRPCEPGQRIDEDWPLDVDADWGYPRSKLEAEEAVLRERGDMPVVLARIASAYDEMCRHPALARHIQRIYERQLTSHLFAGDPDRGMTYIHMEDLVEALVRIVERRRELPPELPLVIGEAEPVSYSELQRELGRLIHGEEWTTQVIPESVARAGAWLQERVSSGEEPFLKPWMISHSDDHYALDTGRARRLLDWEPRHSLRETLPRMVAALKANPVRWYEENELEVPGADQLKAA